MTLIVVSTAVIAAAAVLFLTRVDDEPQLAQQPSPTVASEPRETALPVPTATGPVTVPPGYADLTDGSVYADDRNGDGVIEVDLTIFAVNLHPACTNQDIESEGRMVAVELIVSTGTNATWVREEGWRVFDANGAEIPWNSPGEGWCSLPRPLPPTVEPDTLTSGVVDFDVPAEAMWLGYSSGPEAASTAGGFVIALHE